MLERRTVTTVQLYTSVGKNSNSIKLPLWTKQKTRCPVFTCPAAPALALYSTHQCSLCKNCSAHFSSVFLMSKYSTHLFRFSLCQATRYWVLLWAAPLRGGGGVCSPIEMFSSKNFLKNTENKVMSIWRDFQSTTFKKCYLQPEITQSILPPQDHTTLLLPHCAAFSDQASIILTNGLVR